MKSNYIALTTFVQPSGSYKPSPAPPVAAGRASAFSIGGDFHYTELSSVTFSGVPVYRCNKDLLYLYREGMTWITGRCGDAFNVEEVLPARTRRVGDRGHRHGGAELPTRKTTGACTPLPRASPSNADVVSWGYRTLQARTAPRSCRS